MASKDAFFTFPFNLQPRQVDNLHYGWLQVKNLKQKSFSSSPTRSFQDDKRSEAVGKNAMTFLA
ncbi:hypothetical protein FHS90_004085 [Rufibacter quisquiliarum]|uniref:Uncharacterized protein n=1 Tax=Rufibacter quisquiliarum TaxID=1549639 RepID=A0A839GKZ6_9BACT|nr:hypothetical protein [Rufibacter quisquiliarum]